ncbi:hypothetical protein ABW20_dc0107508 [Dactylellina cionopaga]|nr:hypothetical protein ABW20_dc0107508 [Dactylellina cionopaga]
MVDTTSKKRKKQSEPRVGRKSPSTAFFSWSNPQSSPSANSAEAEILRDQKITPILAGIQAASPDERQQHLAAAFSILEDPSCRKLLLKEHIIRVLMERSLVDSTQEVVTAAWACLNKLVAYEGYDVAVHLYRKGILKLVDGIIDNIEMTITKLSTEPKAVPAAAQALLWDCTYSVVSLLTGLSETTKEIVEELSNKKVLTFASKRLNPSTVPEKVQTAACVFLDRITDGNEAAYVLLSQDSDSIQQLLRNYVTKYDVPSLQSATACSALHNLITQSIAAGDDFSDQYNIADAQLAEQLTTATRTVLSKPIPSQGDQQALFISLETLAGLAGQTIETFGHQAPAGLNGINGNTDEMDEDEDENDEEEDEDDLMEEDLSEPEDNEAGDPDEELPDELGEDLAMVTGEEGTSARASKKKPLNSPELEYLTSTTVSTVLPIATSIPSSELERHINLTSIGLLSSIARAFATLTSKTHKSRFTLSQPILDAYLPLTHAIWNTLITPVLLSNSADVSLAEKITDLSVHITAFTPSVAISNNQHKSFLALYNATLSIPLKVLCIKVLSNLAQCQGSDRIGINKEIGTFFIGTVNKLPYLGDPVVTEELPAPEVVIECLDGVYDVYADLDYDYDEEVFVKLGFLKYLKSFVGRVKGMTKRVDKRKQPELRDSADAALLNLNAFIKYKTQERED